MTYPERFETIRRLIRGEITEAEAQRLMAIPEQVPLTLEAP